MTHLPRLARLYVAAVVAAGAGLLAMALPLARFERPASFAALVALASLTGFFKVGLPRLRGGSTLSVSHAVDLTSLLLLGPHETTLVAATSAWTQGTFWVKERPPLHRTLFNIAGSVIAVEAAGAVFSLLGGTSGSVGIDGLAPPLVGAAAAYYLANTLLLAGAIGLSTRQRLVRIWRDHFLWTAPGYFVGAGVAVPAAMLLEGSSPWLLALAAAPLYLTYRAYQAALERIEAERRHVQEISALHLATIEALARAIDAKDRTSPNHVRRVQHYAAGLARARGVPKLEVQGIMTAALLHDIGKLAVPEHILSKPGPLNSEEFEKIRAHPRVGADIIAGVPFPYEVAPLVLSHHERWDGRGYPAGLKGTEIPLGARILAIVDLFDALTSERPYHRPMSADTAVELLRQEAGKALDPSLVDAFIDVLPVLRAEVACDPRLSGDAPAAPGETLRPAPPAELPRRDVFDDIARAHREIYALYELSQAMGTSLALAETISVITSKLTTLVPFSGAAVFLYDETADVVRCRHASGVDADIVQRIAVRGGEGLNGWVARNRQTLVNARPTADLEAAGLGDATTRLQAALVSPLLLNDRLVGTLCVYHVEPAFYNEDHRRLLDRVAEQAAIAVHNALRFEQTQEESLTDPLTGLPNTRSLFMHLARELARADRLRTEVSLIVMDIDDFKAINDTQGHHMGDRVLCLVAEALRNAIRPYDMCVRYAGDEFILMLSGCGAEEAEHKRRELQQIVAAVNFEVRPGARIGISAGAAVFPGDGITYESLLAAADTRMYRDKTARKQSPAAAQL